MKTKNIKFLILFALAFQAHFFTLAWGQVSQVCTPMSVLGTPVEKRAQKISFADGRQIVVVGHIHGRRMFYDIVKKAYAGVFSRMSDTEFNSYLQDIWKEVTASQASSVSRKKQRELLRLFAQRFGVQVEGFEFQGNGLGLDQETVRLHAIQDYTYIHNLSSSNSNALQFIGLEAPKDDWKANIDYFAKGEAIFYAEFKRREQRGDVSLTEQQVAELVLSGANGEMYSYVSNPRLFNEVPLVGVESDKATEAYSQAEPIQAVTQSYESLRKTDVRFWSTQPKENFEEYVTSFENQVFYSLLESTYIDVVTMSVSSMDILEKRIAFFKSFDRPWLKSSLDKLYAAFRLRLNVNYQRDLDSAKNLANLKKSGVHFVGMNHSANIVDNLVDICEQELK